MKLRNLSSADAHIKISDKERFLIISWCPVGMLIYEKNKRSFFFIIKYWN